MSNFEQQLNAEDIGLFGIDFFPEDENDGVEEVPDNDLIIENGGDVAGLDELNDVDDNDWIRGVPANDLINGNGADIDGLGGFHHVQDQILEFGEHIFGLDGVTLDNIETNEPQDLETKKFPIYVNDQITFSVQLPGECSPGMMRIMQECLSSLENEESAKKLLIEYPIECERRRAVLAAILAFLNYKKDQPGHKFKVIYAAKSFEEMYHVFDELKKFKKINYLANLSVVVLSEKENLCVNEEVLAAKDVASVNQGCEELLQERHGEVCRSACKYYSVDTPSDFDPGFRFVKDGKVQDIEDMMSKGKELEFCPYFYNKKNQSEANFIVCTQEFIVSPMVRKNYNINLESSILIFDDGANISRMCCRESSVDININEIASLSQTLGSIVDTLDNSKICISPDVKLAKGIIYQCMKHLDALSIEPWPIETDEKGVPKRQSIINHLSSCGFTREASMLGKILESLNLVLTEWSLFPALKITNPKRKLEKLIKFLTILKLIFGNNVGTNYEKFYSIQVATPTTSYEKVTTLKLVCPDAAIAFKPFGNAFSVIVASACLAPSAADIYHFDLGFKFELARVSSLYLEKERHLFTYCATGPNEVKYTLDFEHRDLHSVRIEVAESIIKLCEAIPNGVVILFHSKVMMEKMWDFWEKCYDENDVSLRGKFDNVKHVFCELDAETEAETVALVDKYKNKSQSKRGAMLLALHRGRIYGNKIFDLMGKEMRGIVHVGIPFGAWFHEEQVVAKREKIFKSYNNSTSECEKEKENMDWYTMEAFRVINKSFFHRVPTNDYRVNIVLDCRMTKREHLFSKLLPSWIECEGKSSKNFSTLMNNVKWFISAID